MFGIRPYESIVCLIVMSSQTSYYFILTKTMICIFAKSTVVFEGH